MLLFIKKYINFVAIAFSLLLIGIDQFFKYLAIVFLSDKVLTLPVIQDVFHLTYLENRGAAFNMLDGKRFFLVILTGLVLLFIIFVILSDKIKRPFLLWSLSLIIGGGIGNLVDRIFRGFVVDYLDFRVINFAVFNFADCCVVVGTVLVLIYILFLDKTFMSKKDTDVKEEIEENTKTKNEE